jgi:hypothetical protein
VPEVVAEVEVLVLKAEIVLLELLEFGNVKLSEAKLEMLDGAEEVVLLEITAPIEVELVGAEVARVDVVDEIGASLVVIVGAELD